MCYRGIFLAGNAGFSWLGDLAVLIRFYSLVAGGSWLGAGGKLKRKLAQKLNFLLNLELSWELR